MTMTMTQAHQAQIDYDNGVEVREIAKKLGNCSARQVRRFLNVRLSKEEKDWAAQALANGVSQKEIANELGVTASSICRHKSRYKSRQDKTVQDRIVQAREDGVRPEVVASLFGVTLQAVNQLGPTGSTGSTGSKPSDKALILEYINSGESPENIAEKYGIPLVYVEAFIGPFLSGQEDLQTAIQRLGPSGYLDLSDLEMTTETLDEFLELVDLTHVVALNLSNNKLTSLPKKFDQLTNLAAIVLSNNDRQLKVPEELSIIWSAS